MSDYDSIQRHQIWRKRHFWTLGPKRVRVTGFKHSAVDDKIIGVNVVGDSDKVIWVMSAKNGRIKGYELESE